MCLGQVSLEKTTQASSLVSLPGAENMVKYMNDVCPGVMGDFNCHNNSWLDVSLSKFPARSF